MSVQAQLVLARGWSSTVIQLAGGGTRTLGFSHVDIVIPPTELKASDGVDMTKPALLGARSDVIGGKPAGVQIRPWDYGAKTWIRQVIMELPASTMQETLFYGFAREQLGKPYDKLAILAFFTGRNWRDEDAWFCDELLLATTENAHLSPDLYLPTNKFNPTTAACIWSALGAKVVT
jgi:hypothetical protein